MTHLLTKETVIIDLLLSPSKCLSRHDEAQNADTQVKYLKVELKQMYLHECMCMSH